MKFYCVGCNHAWQTLDADIPSQSILKRACPGCMKKMGFKWIDVLGLEFEEIPLEAA